MLYLHEMGKILAGCKVKLSRMYKHLAPHLTHEPTSLAQPFDECLLPLYATPALYNIYLAENSAHAGRLSAWKLLQSCHALRNEMAHLCGQLQAYLMFEVLERAWAELSARLGNVAHLDDLIGKPTPESKSRAHSVREAVLHPCAIAIFGGKSQCWRQMP